MTRTSRHTGAVIGPIVLLALIGGIVFHSGEGWGFKALLNLEAFLLVVLGTGLLVWAAYPIQSWRTPETILYAAQCSTAMGVLGTLLGIIMMLSDVVDISEIPRRTALSLSALFFGLFLSKAILLPMSRRS